MRDFGIEQRPLPQAMATLAFTVWKDAAGTKAGPRDQGQDATPGRSLRALASGLAARFARWRAQAEFDALDPRMVADAGLNREGYCGEQSGRDA